MKAELVSPDGYDIAGNGSVISFNLNPVKLRISGGVSDDPLFMIFEFKNDPAIKDTEVRTSAVGNTVTLTLVNYNNVLGTGTARPVEAGKIGSNKFFLHFRVYAFNDNSDKLLFYTVYSQPLKTVAVRPKPTVKVVKKR